ncbi:hypothetical protein F5883DRAFT_521366 [Diaporthe sp. PMI_573]|nr:hypothetical protein F5883DRAFT_521366 [Diaporthaceae sp. PMI_573]
MWLIGYSCSPFLPSTVSAFSARLPTNHSVFPKPNSAETSSGLAGSILANPNVGDDGTGSTVQKCKYLAERHLNVVMTSLKGVRPTDETCKSLMNQNTVIHIYFQQPHRSGGIHILDLVSRIRLLEQCLELRPGPLLTTEANEHDHIDLTNIPLQQPRPPLPRFMHDDVIDQQRRAGTGGFQPWNKGPEHGHDIPIAPIVCALAEEVRCRRVVLATWLRLEEALFNKTYAPREVIC